MRQRDPAALVDAARAGDRVALARLLSMVERGGDDGRAVARLVFPLGGTAYTVGITGSPGAGKSTLTDQLIRGVRTDGGEVAVLAVDPSSPYSGGAFLGDRVRMQDHATDPGVFVRSMASRGHLGGLALATPEAIRVLDAAGFPLVLVETVGVGQVELEVAGAADTTVVVMNPGAGDAVQAHKAGLIEVADIFVINKADRPGAEQLLSELREALDLTAIDEGDWTPPIVKTVASTGEGVADVRAAVAEHRSFLEAGGGLDERRSRRLHEELREIVARRLDERAFALVGESRFDHLRVGMLGRTVDPYTAADEILATLPS
ncbi:MAG TPA: methylmalonyl Co-A mutase-associated GTPase MeaB [Acidimicrobiales bacterium]|nr:methylmalonyl Co-A mutase-associated GTPase MeaB [Acidimicrobiales bacterium]